MATDMARLGEISQAHRTLRSQFRAEVGSGDFSVSRRRLAGIIAGNHRCLAPTRVWDVLSWPFYVLAEERKAHLEAADIHDPYRLVGELTQRQRLALSKSLVERAR